MLNATELTKGYPTNIQYSIEQTCKKINAAVDKDDLMALEDIGISVKRNPNLILEHDLKDYFLMYIQEAEENIRQKLRQNDNYKIRDFFYQLLKDKNQNISTIMQYSQLPRGVVKSILSNPDTYKRSWDGMKIIIIGSGASMEQFCDMLLSDNMLTIMYWEHIYEGKQHVQLGEVFRSIRMEKGLTQALKGFTQPEVATIENGSRKLSYHKMEVACDALDITVDDFIAELKSRNNNYVHTVSHKIPAILRTSREQKGLSIAEMAKKTGYKQETLRKIERDGVGLSPCIIYKYIKFADAPLEDMVYVCEKQKKFKRVIDRCLGKELGPNQRELFVKEFSTFVQTCAAYQTVTIDDHKINGFLISVLLQLILFSNGKSDEQRLYEYLQMIQEGELPTVAKQSKEDTILNKRQLVQDYKEKTKIKDIPAEKYKKLTQIYEYLLRPKQNAVKLSSIEIVVRTLDEPFYPLVEYNTRFLQKDNKNICDFLELVKTGMVWKYNSIVIPYFELSKLITMAVSADTQQKQQDFFLEIRKFRKKYKIPTK